MSDTPNLGLPLLAAAQAQKHVTMNEALARLDALTSPSIVAADLSAPPAVAQAGDAYIVASPASGEWTDHEGEIAYVVNDGYSFAVPRPGWRAWVETRGAALIWTGQGWIEEPIGPAANGASAQASLIGGDEAFQSGSSFATSLLIPDRAIVLGVTARVLTEITGPGLASWRVGVAGSSDRYGNSIGLAVNSSVIGVSGTPVAYYGDTPLAIEAEGGGFDGGGSVRLAIHLLTLTPPSAV